MVTRADTIGVFQVESRAQAQILPRLRPRTFNDLIVAISLIRPGPLQGDMVHPYLRRRQGLEPVIYKHPLLKGALEETLGVVLFQEQVLKVARDLAGFSGGQGEQLRRALGAKRAPEAIERLRSEFLTGARARGVSESIAIAVFDQLRAFGNYSFPKSHAAAFAVLVYQSAWLKCYYPAAFYCALLNNQPMGFGLQPSLSAMPSGTALRCYPLTSRAAWRAVAATADASGWASTTSLDWGRAAPSGSSTRGRPGRSPISRTSAVVRASRAASSRR
jgi:error-prone DNA polymerase